MTAPVPQPTLRGEIESALRDNGLAYTAKQLAGHLGAAVEATRSALSELAREGRVSSRQLRIGETLYRYRGRREQSMAAPLTHSFYVQKGAR